MTFSRKQYAALLCLCLPVLVVSMDVSVLFFAVPDIARDLHPSAAQQLWIFDVYGFVLAGLLLTMGSLGDRIGRRRLLLLGGAAFSAASLLAAYAQSAEGLVLARAAMGLGGATLMPSTLALIRSVFDDDALRTRAVAIWSAVLAAGIGIGPVVSGVLLEHFWWGSVFLINLPVMLLLLVVAPVLLPESRGTTEGRFEWISAALSLGAVLAFVYGVKEVAADGWSLSHVAEAAAGVVLGWLFLRRQSRLVHPLLDPALVRHPGVLTALTANIVATLALVGNAVIITSYLQSVLGMSPLRAALWSLLPSVFVGAAAPLAAAAAGRWGRPVVIGAGFVGGSLGFLVLMQASEHSALIVPLVGATLVACGLVSVVMLVTDLVVAVAPAERSGTASGLLETSSEFAGALGIALLGSAVNVVYRHHMHVGPPAARQSLAGAVGVGNPSVLVPARTAYVSAMHAADLIAAALLLIGALLMRRWVGRGATSSQAVEAGEGQVSSEFTSETSASTKS